MLPTRAPEKWVKVGRVNKPGESVTETGIRINARPVANCDQKFAWVSRIHISVAQTGDRFFLSLSNSRLLIVLNQLLILYPSLYANNMVLLCINILYINSCITVIIYLYKHTQNIANIYGNPNFLQCSFLKLYVS
jgi:hypothetical protein